MIITGKMIKDVYGYNCKRIPSGACLVYLYKRFGASTNGHDKRKTVCRYMLETDVEGLFVNFDIGGTSADIRTSYTHGISQAFIESESEVLERWRQSESIEPDTVFQYDQYPPNCFAGDFVSAVLDVLRKCLEPVAVRDVFINILGECEPPTLTNGVE